MSKVKCIVIESSPERTNARAVTNEDGNAHVYATISEARAELKANGYSYSRADDRYYIRGTEYRAYIIREDSEEYAEIIVSQAHEAAARRLVSAYAEAIGDAVTEDDPEAIAAHQVARECLGYTTATAEQRATVASMVDAITQQAERIAADRIAPEAAKEYGSYEDALNDTAYTVYSLMTGERMPDTPEDFTRLDRIMGYAAKVIPAEPHPYQRAELEAYLGSAINGYDVDAIEAEATEHDPKTGRTVWTPEAVRDLWTICERHERTTLATYPTEDAAYAAGARHIVEVIPHEAAARAYEAAEQAAKAIPETHNRKRADARTAAIDAVVKQAARYADATETAAHIAGQPVDYLHKHTVNLGTSKWQDYRAEYEQMADSLILHATASRTGKSVERIPLVYVVLVID